MSPTPANPGLRVIDGGHGHMQQVPPQNNDIEQALLGALLVDNQLYYHVFEIVSGEDFFDPIHQKIYETIARSIDAGRVANPQTLYPQFVDDPALRNLGGASYLTDLACSVISLVSAKDYALLVHELATRRRLIALAAEISAIAHDHSSQPTSGEALISDAEPDCLH